jgi:hypothetical protein
MLTDDETRMAKTICTERLKAIDTGAGTTKKLS